MKPIINKSYYEKIKKEFTEECKAKLGDELVSIIDKSTSKGKIRGGISDLDIVVIFKSNNSEIHPWSETVLLNKPRRFIFANKYNKKMKNYFKNRGFYSFRAKPFGFAFISEKYFLEKHASEKELRVLSKKTGLKYVYGSGTLEFGSPKGIGFYLYKNSKILAGEDITAKIKKPRWKEVEKDLFERAKIIHKDAHIVLDCVDFTKEPEKYIQFAVSFSFPLAATMIELKTKKVVLGKSNIQREYIKKFGHLDEALYFQLVGTYYEFWNLLTKNKDLFEPVYMNALKFIDMSYKRILKYEKTGKLF